MKTGLKIGLNRLMLIALFGFALLCISSYAFHSTVGIDAEPYANGKVQQHYYRLWWTGHGAILLGHGVTVRDYDPAKTYDRFDFASALFRTPDPLKPLPQSDWNRWGFWYINTPMPTQQFWVGIPGWLPIVVMAVYFFRRSKKKILPCSSFGKGGE